MEIIKRILGFKSKHNLNDKYSLPAKQLVTISYALAVSSYTPLSSAFSELKKVEENNELSLWDYLITIAGIGVAFSRLAYSVDETELDAYSNSIKYAVDDWNNKAWADVSEIVRYLAQGLSADVIKDMDTFREAVGGWVFIKFDQRGTRIVEWNNSNKSNILFALGQGPTDAFWDYWREMSTMKKQDY